MRSGCGSGRSARQSDSPRSGCTSTSRIWGDWLPDLATGWTLIACGLVAWALRPESRSGPLLAATGFAWFAANLVGEQALYLYRGPLIHLSLSYPYGRLGRPLDRSVVAIGYGAALVPAVWSSEIATFALSALFVAVAGHGYIRALGRERRTRLAALGATAFVSAVLVGTATARLASPTPELTDATLLVYEAALCALAVVLLAGLVLEPWARTRVADLVVDLASGGLRHSARRARPGARRSHARDRLSARSRLRRLGGTAACAAGGGVGPQGHPYRPGRQGDRGAGARRGSAR